MITFGKQILDQLTKENLFHSFFSIDNLKVVYEKNIAHSTSSGLDYISHELFLNKIESELDIISSKARSDRYKFTKYKLKLISKGRAKVPREISIPTIRDRITLRCLCDYLGEVFKDNIKHTLPQKMIHRVVSEIPFYDGFIKLDVENFYPSIRHDILKNILEDKLPTSAVNLIMSSITTPTVSFSSNQDAPMALGVPQGTSISNILAHIYLNCVDEKYMSSTEYRYYRYVDDILVLCNINEAHTLAENIILDFKTLDLKIHDVSPKSEKSCIGSMSDIFSYLGYSFDNGKISARQSSTKNLKNSLASIFTSYKYSREKRVEYLQWRLHLRISGCIYDKKCKGWLFFFSEMNDLSSLYILDNYIKKLLARYQTKISVPSFGKCLHEIKHNRYQSKTIMNYDNFNIIEMRNFLTNVFNYDLSDASDGKVEFIFHKKLRRETSELLVDIQNFS
jgi:RNA-directed DNA polymerase